MTNILFNPKETIDTITDTFETILFVSIIKDIVEKTNPNKILPALKEVARRNNYNLSDSLDRKIANIVLVNYVLKN